MSDSIVLRSPTINDLSRLAKLGRDTFVETFGELYSPADLQIFLDQVYSEAVVAQELADSRLTFQVLDDGKELVGFIKIGPPHVPVNNPPPDAMEIWQLYVRQSLMRRGLGTRMMGWADAQFRERGAGVVYVSVFSENLRAINFYGQHGFQKVGDYGFNVGQQIDLEWIMQRG